MSTIDDLKGFPYLIKACLGQGYITRSSVGGGQVRITSEAGGAKPPPSFQKMIEKNRACIYVSTDFID